MSLKITDGEIVRISWGALLVVLAGVVSLGIWIARVEAAAQVSDDVAEALISIDKRLSVIETTLKIKENKNE